MCRFCQGKHHYLICSVGNRSNTVGQDRQLEGLKPTAPTPTCKEKSESKSYNVVLFKFEQ